LRDRVLTACNQSSSGKIHEGYSDRSFSSCSHRLCARRFRERCFQQGSRSRVPAAWYEAFDTTTPRRIALRTRPRDAATFDARKPEWLCSRSDYGDGRRLRHERWVRPGDLEVWLLTFGLRPQRRVVASIKLNARLRLRHAPLLLPSVLVARPPTMLCAIRRRHRPSGGPAPHQPDACTSG
jgi:hypothetical protein